MSHETLQDVYAAEQMPQEIQKQIAVLESTSQAVLIPQAQNDLQQCIEQAYDRGSISEGTRTYLSAHYLHDAFLPEQIS